MTSAQSAEQMRRPRAAWAACSLIFVIAVLMAVWGVMTWSRRGGFDAAVHKVFVPNPDADITVGYLEFAYIAGAVMSFAFAACFLLIGAYVSIARNWARILMITGSCIALPYVLATYVFNAASYLKDIDTGPTDAVARAELIQLNSLTPWRFSGWYHGLTVSFGIAICIGVIGIIVLLMSRSSKAYYRAHRPGQP